MGETVAKRKAAQEISFELKYCERCGGLWLRPGGGQQVYCVACGRAVAELPQVSRVPDAETAEQRWEAEEYGFWAYGEDGENDADAVGGVA